MKLSEKVIFIISHENWGSMHMSKHHYAIELGKSGNKVYFINHPDMRKELKRGEMKLVSTGSQNVSVVQHRLFHPYFLKFKFKALYNFLTWFHIWKILKIIGSKPTVVWSFDTGNALPLKYFPDSAIKIYMPVDGPFGSVHERRSAEESDMIISVTNKILNSYDIFDKPKLQINHGVAEVFLYKNYEKVKSPKIRIGYSGSLIRNDLDTDSFLKIINGHPDKIFEFWGEYDHRKSNIHLPQDVTKGTIQFLDIMKRLPNVIMHGPVSSEMLACGIRQMDILLICYNIKNDQNHHKVLEYLGTGNVIVSNYMSSYNDKPELIEMVNSPENNDELPEIFNKVINNLDKFNSNEMREKRMKYARDFSYSNNIKRIENFIATVTAIR